MIGLGCFGTGLYSQLAYEDIWNYAVSHENSESPTVQKIAFTGRLQGEAFWFDADQRNANDAIWILITGKLYLVPYHQISFPLIEGQGLEYTEIYLLWHIRLCRFFKKFSDHMITQCLRWSLIDFKVSIIADPVY